MEFRSFYSKLKLFLNFHILRYLSFEQCLFLLGIFKYSVLCLVYWDIQKKEKVWAAPNKTL